MATYSGIKGFTIQSLASDPYASAAASGTWASAANLNTGGTNAAGATAGSQTAALIFAGDRPSRTNITEKFDGVFAQASLLHIPKKDTPHLVKN